MSILKVMTRAQRILTVIRSLVTFFPVIISPIFLSGCAQSFYDSPPRTLSFDEGENAGDSLFVSYRKDLQYIMGNPRYGAKEEQKKVMCVALKITNKSNRTLHLTPVNFGIYGNGDNEKKVYSPNEYCKVVRQATVIRLLNLPGYCGGFQIEDMANALNANGRNRDFQKENKIWTNRLSRVGPSTVSYASIRPAKNH